MPTKKLSTDLPSGGVGMLNWETIHLSVGWDLIRYAAGASSALAAPVGVVPFAGLRPTSSSSWKS